MELGKTPSLFLDIEQQVSRGSKRADHATNDFKMDRAACTLCSSCVLMWVPALLRWEEATLHVHRLFFVIAWAVQRSKSVHAGRKRDKPIALTSFYISHCDELSINREMIHICGPTRRSGGVAWIIEWWRKCFSVMNFASDRFLTAEAPPACKPSLQRALWHCVYTQHSTDAFQEILHLWGRGKPGTKTV